MSIVPDLEHCPDQFVFKADIWREDFPVSGVLAVMLSAAKHLCAPQARPFAEFTLSGANVLRVTARLPTH